MVHILYNLIYFSGISIWLSKWDITEKNAPLVLTSHVTHAPVSVNALSGVDE